MPDRYQIINLIEKNKLGSIYLAEDTVLQRKVIYRVFDNNVQNSTLEGFSQYTGKLCALQHPNLLPIFDIAKHENGYCMVTQVLEAESLEERLKKGPLSPVGVYNMASNLLDALLTTHAVDLYHGAFRTDSIKRVPSVRGGHRYIIVDFGLDRISSMICGTPVFMADPVLMAPELIDGTSFPNASTDLFTLGQLCYISLAGGHPYAEKTPPERLHAYRQGGLPHLSTYADNVQKDFADWIMSLVKPSPGDRPISVQSAMVSLHAIRLNAPAPNVVGKTQAVAGVTPNQATAPISNAAPYTKIAATRPMQTGGTLIADRPTKKVRVYQPSAAPKETGRIFRFLAVVVTLLLVIGLAAFALTKADLFSTLQNKIQTTLQKTPKPPEIPPHEKPQLVAQSLHYIPLREDVPPNVKFNSKKLKDWTVVTGPPAATTRKTKGNGKLYIKNILAIGKFTEFIAPKKKVAFQTQQFLITSNLSITNTSQGKAKQGEGWDVVIKVPEEHNSPLKVTLLMFQKGCDFEILVTSPHTANENITTLTVPQSSPGMVSIPITIEKPRSGYYSFKVLSSLAIPEAYFEMGLVSVFVE